MSLLGQTSESRTIVSHHKRKETLPLLPPPKQRVTFCHVSWGFAKKQNKSSWEMCHGNAFLLPSKNGLKTNFKKVLRVRVKLQV
jgi:hypothetical protein